MFGYECFKSRYFQACPQNQAGCADPRDVIAGRRSVLR